MYSVTTKKLLSLLTAFAMVLSMVAIVQPIQTSAATVEIPISNGDFENGAFGGAVSTNGAATIVDNKNVHSGNYSVHLTKDGTNPNGTMTITVYPQATDADRTLTMKFWMMIPSGSTANSIHTQMLAWREWGALLSEQYGAQYVAVDGNWYEKTVSVPVPANTGIVQVQLYAADTGTTPYIDDISMELDGVDLMTNGGLENGALNGGISTSSGSIELIHQPVHGGSYAAHADKTNGGNITTTVAIEASSEAREMTLSYWLYVTPGATNSAHNAVLCFDTVSNSPSWTLLSENYGAQYAVPGVWTQMSLPVAVAANTDTVQIQIYAQDDGADFYIDDLTLTEEVADIVNHEAVIGLNQVTGDGTWQLSVTSETDIPATYYKIPATIDGAQCNVLAEYNGDILIIYPNFFPALGGAVPAEQIVIAEGAVLKAVDSANGWAEVEDTDTVTLTQALDLNYVDGAWSKTVYTTNVTMGLNVVTSDGTWQLSISGEDAIATGYYKIPATIDGAQCNVLAEYNGDILIIYPNFFPALGGAVPTSQIVIAEGAVLKAVDSANGWAEIADANTLTLTQALDLSYVDGRWSKTVYTTNVTMGLNVVTGDGTWQLSISGEDAIATGYYKIPATIDGAQCNILAQYNGEILIVYPDFFRALGGAVPTESFVIAENAVLKAVDSTNGWAELADVNTLTVTNGLNVEYTLGAWLDMSQYSNVNFAEISASDISVYKWEDQAESNYRSVLGIKADSVTIDNDANWGNFTKVASKVLIDGVEVSVTFGMVPVSGDSSWSANGMLLYITGEGYWDAVTTASSVTICAGTTLISGVDATHGYRFVEDVVLYKNCDGSWDTTADTHVYNQQSTELEGALVSEANCQSAAVYYYSCTCGQLGSETFTYGEIGDHSPVNGICSVCGEAVTVQNITVSFQTVASDGTWQLVPSATPSGTYYKIPVTIDGVAGNVLAKYESGMLLIYPSFMTALGSTVPTESFVIAEGTVLKAVDSANGWAEIEGATALNVTAELEITNNAGKWCEMSKYADVTFTEIYASDLDLYYQNIIKLEDYSEAEINAYLMLNPEYKPLYEKYGNKANMTTIGIKSNNSNLVIPNDENWSTMTLLGTVTVAGATAEETYVMQTVATGTEDSETAMDNGFLIRFYNGYILEQATTITIEPGTKIVTASGVGFVFVDGYTICRNSSDTWADHTYTATVTAPTCTAAGYTTYTCSHCGDSYTGDNVAALGHQLGENGVCVNGGEILVAVDGTYLPMAEALEMGKDIQLIADTTAQDVVLGTGVTLDLNGYTLTAQSVDATAAGAQIMGTGLLKADAEFNENNSQLPIYDEAAEGYRFFEVSVEAVTVTGKNSGNPKYWFKINFVDFEEVYNLIQAGSEVNIAVKMAWNGGEAEATADADFLAKWAAKGGDCYITVSAVNAENLEDFSLTPCVTANGVCVNGDAM